MGQNRALTSRDFEFGDLEIGETWLKMLYVREIRRQHRPDREGDNGTIAIDAWAQGPSDSSYVRKLWRLESPGSSAWLLRDYFHAVRPGCCGSPAVHTYYSLATGRPVVSFTDGPVGVWGEMGVHQRERRPLGVTYLNSIAAGESPYLKSVKNPVGELQFTVGDSVIDRVILVSADTRYVDYPTPTLTLIAADGFETNVGLGLREGGFATVHLTWYLGSATKSVVAVRVGAAGFSLDNVSLPPPISARRVP